MSPNALLVEDELIMRLTYAKNLRAVGCSVDSVPTFDEAINKIKANKLYNLLLCDTSLVEDGKETNTLGVGVATEFRKCFPNAVIIGMSMIESNKAYWEGKCDYFLKKEVSLELSLGKIITNHFG